MSDAKRLMDLAARVAALYGPDREVDAEILGSFRGVAVTRGSEGAGDWYRVGAGTPTLVPAYTRSLDAALTLVPQGWEIEWADTNAGLKWLVQLSNRDSNHPLCRFANSWSGEEARTRDRRPGPIAVSAAALRARATTTHPQETGDG